MINISLIVLLSILSWLHYKDIVKLRYEKELLNTRISLLEEEVYSKGEN